MQLTIQVNDSYGMPLDINDFVLVTYPNEKMVDIGIVLWNQKEMTLVLKIWNASQSISYYLKYCKLTFLGSLSSHPKLTNYEGKHVFKSKKDACSYLDNMECDLRGLPITTTKRKSIGSGIKTHKLPKRNLYDLFA
jgi:hypothetical protein